MKDIEWVLGFLIALERNGQHAPVETMRRVIDSHLELESVLQKLYDLRNLHLTRAGAAGCRQTSTGEWVTDPISEAYNEAGELLKKIKGQE